MEQKALARRSRPVRVVDQAMNDRPSLARRSYVAALTALSTILAMMAPGAPGPGPDGDGGDDFGDGFDCTMSPGKARRCFILPPIAGAGGFCPSIGGA